MDEEYDTPLGLAIEAIENCWQGLYGDLQVVTGEVLASVAATQLAVASKRWAKIPREIRRENWS